MLSAASPLACGDSTANDASNANTDDRDAGVDERPIDGGLDGATEGGSPIVAEVTFTPEAVAFDAPDLTNPLRGQYAWLGTPPTPKEWVNADRYQRWNWIDIEPSHGNYAWQIVDDEIAKAKAAHGRFGMRVMALCQDCSNHQYQGAYSAIPDDLVAASNAFVGAPPGQSKKYVLPDWNSKGYLDRLDELARAIAARYRDEPTFAFVDIFSYGNWGEFHLYPFDQPGGPYEKSAQRPITDDNARLVVKRAAAAFDNKILVLNASNVAALKEAVASTAPPIGIRVDCLGSDDLAGGGPNLRATPGAKEHWRKAIFVTEWCQRNLGSSGANLFVQGEKQVRDHHVSMLSSGNFDHAPASADEIAAFRKANVEAGYRLRASEVALQVGADGAISVRSRWNDDGIAPTYLRWRVVVGLKGATNVERPLAMDLREAMPDAPLDHDETVRAPAPLPSGTYQVYLRVEDVQGISPPMQLAMKGRDADGNYGLGSITVP